MCDISKQWLVCVNVSVFCPILCCILYKELLKVVVGAIFKTRGLCLNTHNFVTISHTNLIASRYIDLPFPCILVWLTN